MTECHQDGWQCQHAWPEVTAMVGFRNATRGEAVTDWWDNGGNAIAFGRGSKGFVVINHEDTALAETLTTSLPAGEYCDVLSGTSVTVDDGGTLTVSLAPDTALALYTGARSCG